MRALGSLAIDAAYVEQVVLDLVSIPSVSGEEDRVSTWTAQTMRSLGLDAIEQEVLPGRRNVIATLDTGIPGPTLLFNGHLDTLAIPPGWRGDPYDARRVGDRLVGAEINNMKGAIGAMTGALQVAVRRRDELCGRVILSAVIGECDALGLGTVHMLEQGVLADGCINGEPTDLRVMTAHAGVTQLRIHVRGRSAHICQRVYGINAVEKLVGLLAELDETALRSSSHPDFPGLPTLNVGMVRGGNLASMLAEQAEALVDVRTVPGMTPEDVRDDIESAIERRKTRDRQLDAVVELLDRPRFVQQYPFHVARDEPIVAAVARAHEQVTGSAPETGAFHPQVFFGTDASHILRAGIPTVIYGPGKVEDINTADESIAVCDLITASEVYWTCIRDVCGRK